MRKKFYLTLDTETATMGFSDNICKNENDKQKIAISRPIIYDIGWVITDRKGEVYIKKNYLVQETFFVPQIFFTAYYKDKRPFYMDLLAKGEIETKCWNDIADELKKDLDIVDYCTAYNGAFDFKKAIPFTEEYIAHLYSDDFVKWELGQKRLCEKILGGVKKETSNPEFLNPVFKFRGGEYDIIDLWAVACDKLINIDKYRNFCLDNSYLTASKQFFKTSAETTYQYIMHNYNFVENHTALSDAEIEAEILTKALKRGKIEPTLKEFPFKTLGTTYDYVINKKPKYKDYLYNEIAKYVNGRNLSPSYMTKLNNILDSLVQN